MRYAVAGFLIVLSGCARQDIDFKPPPGWTSTPNIMGNQMFIKPGSTSSTEFIMMMRVPMPQPSSRKSADDRSEAITICGGHPATLMQTRVAAKNGGDKKDQLMEAVSTKWDSDSVTAIYSRPVGTPADPEAEAAIKSLCKASG